MKRTMRVFLGDENLSVGQLHHAALGAREHASFEYDPTWLGAPNHFAIDPALPLVAGPQFHRKAGDGSIFHSAIADTEPDGWSRRVILRDHAKRRQEAKRSGAAVEHRALDALDFLLAVDDLRPKCTVVDDDGRLSIGKFPSVSDERAVTKGEVLAMRLAKTAGINAAAARVVDSDGVPVALVRRFDRLESGKRLMYVSAATMLGAAASDASDHAYTDLVDVLRTSGAAAQTDIDELWRRMAFSILITNVDDHLHNHGFLHVERGNWRLAPAFDLNPFPERARELKTWISEETGPEATVDALLSVAPYFRISANRALDILREVEQAVERWREEGRAIGMSELELDQFEDAFEHAERNAARLAMGR